MANTKPLASQVRYTEYGTLTETTLQAQLRGDNVAAPAIRGFWADLQEQCGACYRYR